MSNFLLKKKTMLSGSSVFWLPSGVGRNDVVGAYRFKGVSSEAFALQDLSTRRYNLIKYKQTYSGTDHIPTWSSANGFAFDAVYGGLSGYLDNPALDQSDIKSAVICFSGVTQNNRVILISAGGASGKVQIFAATSAQVITSISGDTVVSNYQNFGGPGFVSSAYASYTTVGKMKYSGNTQKASGVIGVNFDANKMYLDGVEASLNDTTAEFHTYTDIGDAGKQGYTFGNSHSGKPELNNAVFGGKVIIAAAFYSVELTAEQHAEASAMMLAL